MDDRNLDVLQNLEFAVVEVWRKHPDMTDYVALRAYEAAFEHYRAEARGHAPKSPLLSGLDRAAFDALTAICEWRLGRGVGPTGVRLDTTPIAVGELVDCLSKLKKSVARHTKAEGRQGYLTFIDEFLP